MAPCTTRAWWPRHIARWSAAGRWMGFPAWQCDALARPGHCAAQAWRGGKGRGGKGPRGAVLCNPGPTFETIALAVTSPPSPAWACLDCAPHPIVGWAADRAPRLPAPRLPIKAPRRHAQVLEPCAPPVGQPSYSTFCGDRSSTCLSIRLNGRTLSHASSGAWGNPLGPLGLARVGLNGIRPGLSNAQLSGPAQPGPNSLGLAERSGAAGWAGRLLDIGSRMGGKWYGSSWASRAHEHPAC